MPPMCANRAAALTFGTNPIVCSLRHFSQNVVGIERQGAEIEVGTDLDMRRASLHLLLQLLCCRYNRHLRALQQLPHSPGHALHNSTLPTREELQTHQMAMQ